MCEFTPDMLHDIEQSLYTVFWLGAAIGGFIISVFFSWLSDSLSFASVGAFRRLRRYLDLKARRKYPLGRESE